jgi:hypothetical protein
MSDSARRVVSGGSVLPFISWLGNGRHRTAVHAFAPGRALALCKAARRVGEHWKPLEGRPRCRKCEAEAARMAGGGAV